MTLADQLGPEVCHGGSSATYFFTDFNGAFLRRSVESGSPGKPAGVLISAAMMPGWATMQRSDVLLVPDWGEVRIDPFSKEALLFAHPRDPDFPHEDFAPDVRAVVSRAERAVLNQDFADEVRVGVELEFYVFDSIRYVASALDNGVRIVEGDGWNSDRPPGVGHSIGHACMHYAAPPLDRLSELREEIVRKLSRLGIATVHHSHESGCSQCELALAPASPRHAADAVQLAKYVVRRECAERGLSATFMPKPVAYASGSGMHINLSLWRDGRNQFYEPGGGLARTGQHFAAGVLAHARALAAITNPTTNSYKRLLDAYSSHRAARLGFGDRTAEIRIPKSIDEDGFRIEVRFPDTSANPYLAIAAILLAGVDGIEQQSSLPSTADDSEPYPVFDIRKIDMGALPVDLLSAVRALVQDCEFLRRDASFGQKLLDTLVENASYFVRWHGAMPAPVEYLVTYSI